MSSYNISEIISKIEEKTNSKEIIWSQYNPLYDSNPYTQKYFSTINGLQYDDGYAAKFKNGFIYLIPGDAFTIYLFLQSSRSNIPVALNYGPSNDLYDGQLQSLYETIRDSFSSLNDFLNDILK